MLVEHTNIPYFYVHSMKQLFFFLIVALLFCIHSQEEAKSPPTYYRCNTDPRSKHQFPYLAYTQKVSPEGTSSVHIVPQATVPPGYAQQTWKEYVVDPNHREELAWTIAGATVWYATLFALGFIGFSSSRLFKACPCGEKYPLVDILAATTVLLATPLAWIRYQHHNAHRLQTLVKKEQLCMKQLLSPDKKQ